MTPCILPNKEFTIQARQWHWDFFVAGWMLARQHNVLAHVLAAEVVFNRASELWKSGRSRKWQSIRNYSYNKKLSTKFDDLGVIIIRKRCSIQQSEKYNCSITASPENRLFLFFWGGGGTRYSSHGGESPSYDLFHECHGQTKRLYTSLIALFSTVYYFHYLGSPFLIIKANV